MNCCQGMVAISVSLRVFCRLSEQEVLAQSRSGVSLYPHMMAVTGPKRFLFFVFSFSGLVSVFFLNFHNLYSGLHYYGVLVYEQHCFFSVVNDYIVFLHSCFGVETGFVEILVSYFVLFLKINLFNAGCTD